MLRAIITLTLSIFALHHGLDAQTLERFRPKGGTTNDGANVTLRTRATIVDLQVHANGIFACTEKAGCFLLPTSEPEHAIPVASMQNRQDKFGQILLIDGHPQVLVNGYQLQALNPEETVRRNALPVQMAQTIEAKGYELLEDGRLVVASTLDGVLIYEPSTDPQQVFATVPRRLSTIDQQLPSNRIHCLYEDKDGILWIGTAAGLAALYEDQVYNLSISPVTEPQPNFWQRLFGAKTTTPKPYDGPITTITSWGNSLIFTSQNYLYKSTRKLTPLTQAHRYTGTPKDAFGEMGIQDIQVTGQGTVWLAAEQLVRYDITSDLWQVIPTSGRATDTSSPITSLLADEWNGYLWVGTAGRGLQRLSLPDIAD